MTVKTLSVAFLSAALLAACQQGAGFDAPVIPLTGVDAPAAVSYTHLTLPTKA